MRERTSQSHRRASHVSNEDIIDASIGQQPDDLVHEVTELVRAIRNIKESLILSQNHESAPLQSAYDTKVDLPRLLCPLFSATT